MADIRTGFDAKFLEVIPATLEDFTASGLISGVSLNVNVKSAESDLVLLFDLNKNTSGLPKEIEFENVKHISGYAHPQIADLEALGIVKKNNSKGVIDVEKMIEKINSRSVTVIIKSKFPKNLLAQMIKVHEKLGGIVISGIKIEKREEYAQKRLQELEEREQKLEERANRRGKK